MICRDVLDWMEGAAPARLMLEWDYSGLAAGNPAQEIRGVLTCLDVTEDAIRQAVRLDLDLIVCHHPPIFRKMRSFSEETPEGRLLAEAIRRRICVFGAHTNFDLAAGGLTDALAEHLGLEQTAGWGIVRETACRKLITFVPRSELSRVREAMFAAGAGALGRYSDCAFVADGIGSFRPLPGSHPAIGSENRMEQVEETRLETLVAEERLQDVLAALWRAHPYEEPAVDIVSLDSPKEKLWLGRVGTLPVPLDEASFAALLRQKLGAKPLRAVGRAPAIIKKVAVQNGSWDSSFLRAAAKCGADVLVTGDIKYHDARDLEREGLYAIDAGHFPTERIFAPLLAERLRAAFPGIPVHAAEETDAYRAL